MELSQLHRHSLALVSSVKARGSKDITAIPIELSLSRGGEVASVSDVQEVNVKTDSGDDSVNVQTGNSIPATWLSLNSNRVTAPDVRRNDLVTLYRLGDTDKYYWMDHNVENVKRLETAVFAWSADPNNPINDDLSNAYALQISTHDGNITLTTSKANGEPFKYTLQLNTADGVFTLQDDVGTEIYLDSANTDVGMNNADGTQVHLKKRNINMYAPDTLKMIAENLISMKCKDYILDASNSISVNTKTHTTKAKTITENATSITHDADTTICTGHLSAGSISVGGGAKGTGKCTVAGELTAQSIDCIKFTAQQGHISKFSHDGSKCC